ncbi:MAG TPA: GAF domain-containing protein [Candidatus Limnocylindrales bacterium]|nr:GAF domain-containing protein [Candidatus Limnocylindrales bacterium]
MNELRRLIVRHRHVGPLVASLLAGTDAQVTIRDAEGETILDRGGLGGGERFPIVAEYDTIGWVEGGRTARVVASVLSYAASRERDKRSLAAEALERYRELSLIYDLADALGARDDEAAVGALVADQLARLADGAAAFVLELGDDGALSPVAGTTLPTGLAALRAGEGIIGRTVAADAQPELVEHPAEDARAGPGERDGGPILVAPMRVGGRVTGVVGVITPQGTTLRAADLKVVAAIAALAGPALAHVGRRGSAGRRAAGPAPAG